MEDYSGLTLLAGESVVAGESKLFEIHAK
jgi:PTS system N-acetylglucosamine-specific IIC component